MTELKCPICNIPLERIGDLFQCPNDHCGYVGNEELWQALIDAYEEKDLSDIALIKRTKEQDNTNKKLDIAVSQLKKTRDYIEDCRYQETNYFLVDSKDVSIMLDETNEALEQINNLPS